MAKIDISGLDEAEAAFFKKETGITEVVPKMVKRGAEIIAESQRAAAKRMFRSKRSTQDLAESIKAHPVKGDDTRQYSDIYPHGTNRRGERNATVGFVQQYGRKNMPASPYMTEGNNEGAEKASAEMQKIFKEGMNK